jgi:hypothetical protein
MGNLRDAVARVPRDNPAQERGERQTMKHRVISVFHSFPSLGLAIVVLALAVPTSASAAAFTARLSAPNHSPTAGKPWTTTVTATRGQKKLSGTVRYQVIYQGKVVNTQPVRSFQDGAYHRTLVFPPAAVGVQLTLRVRVTTRFGTVVRDWAFEPRA